MRIGEVLTMAEYIERETAVAWFMPYAHAGESIDADVVITDIKGMKAADVAPVRHGRWIGCNGEIVDWDENNPGCPRHSCFCSICKSWLTASDEFPVIAYFCPNCGAKMDLEG